MLISALVTPFRSGCARATGAAIDPEGMFELDLDSAAALARFQLEHGCDQVLLAATTGEGNALDDAERARLLDAVLGVARPEQVMVALGAGRVPDVIARGRTALARGVRDLLLMDAPCSGASSASLRECWHAPIARALPDARLWPHAVPARTGTELLPDDLARLAEDCPNVVGVKDATGRLARMARVRALCGEDFRILCGDDAMLRDALIDPHIRADGAVAMTSNLAPAAMRALLDAGRGLDAVLARELHDSLGLLFGLVCVTSEEDLVVRGQRLAVPQRSRNPVPLKSALAQLGVMEAWCRAPLGAIGSNGAERVRSALWLTARRHPGILRPLSERFGVDLAAHLDPVNARLAATATSAATPAATATATAAATTAAAAAATTTAAAAEEALGAPVQTAPVSGAPALPVRNKPTPSGGANREFAGSW